MSTKPKTDHGTRQSRRRAKYLAEQDRRLLESLVAIRRSSGLKQEDVAELLGVSQQAVSKFESTESSPSLARVRHYAHAVGALVAHVVSEDVGQLEEHGNDWIRITFVDEKRSWDANLQNIVKRASVKFFTAEECLASHDWLTTWIHHDDAHSPSSPNIDFAAIQSEAAASKRTDFALGA